jgi:4-carboxymuconolactone decarboxylase
MADETTRDKGLDTFEQVMGFRPPDLRGDPFLDVTIDHLFAKVWAHPGLSVRDRRLVTLTVLMCLGHEATLELHLNAALRTGQLSDVELDELIVHVAHYGGWPPAAIASQVLRRVRAKRAAEGERG